ncbi:amino acid adenylation domain-containing protein [Allokutzneria sp. A3M-2-11 16]|uniref:amino acid adenylation domain-containing protein n=1 Tax=Allokutzneria sp. A3M-2-11 16 TaxID=2962043 RepID=UPI0020B7BAAB|nr:amino acid adenylation domain-containing protein [Allokutzneria sp. A3M-2-11 16]MCP3803351.1 amino acid adenylation domain-containing protein [Allokutzneria sp. A3M-2-11 16]
MDTTHGHLVGLWGGDAAAPALLASLAATARARAEEIAIVDETRELTYAQLSGWIAQIAETLTAQGIRPRDRVAVTGRRGAEAVAAFLAVLSVGATYVPLDQEYPVKRLRHMLGDSEARLVLFASQEPAFDTGVPTLPIPEPDGRARAREIDEHVTGLAVDDLPMYVIYTSGSTGWPKGVAIPHRCLANMAEWQRTHSPRRDLRTAQFAPLNFDVFFQEVLGTLCGGGTLVVMPEHLRRDPFALLAWAVDHRIERLFLPNMALQMLAVAASVEASAEALRLVEVNTAGEQLICTPQIRELFDRLPRCRLVNHYGQSESAMVTSHILTGPSRDWPALPPIGVPLPGCEVLVDPVDPADPAVGELLVAGAAVSLGYHGLPELTEAKYPELPPTRHGHRRVFRTGDLVRIADGVVQFLTRIDDEVKIRGVRVNLLEVDAWLVAQPDVLAAVAVVVETAPGTRVLRAAATAADGVALDTDVLLKQLGEVLPAVSVPATLTVLPELPRSPSGKIDRTKVAELLAAAY